MSRWSVVYKSSGYKTGNLLFPKRLSQEFLEEQRRVMGSYFFANQYENECIPDDERRFKKNWLKYSQIIPENCHHFAFIDPAIGQKDHNDFTGVVVIAADYQGNWYVRIANRYRLTPSEIVNKCFEIQKQFKCMAIGVEAVAYQEALLYMLSDEMKRRREIIPIKDIKRNNVSKETRILSLVPRFEWGRIYLHPGLNDLEDEYGSFPRGKWDDLLDCLCSLEELVIYPQFKEKTIERPNSPSDPNYEHWYIRQVTNENGARNQSGDQDY